MVFELFDKDGQKDLTKMIKVVTTCRGLVCFGPEREPGLFEQRLNFRVWIRRQALNFKRQIQFDIVNAFLTYCLIVRGSIFILFIICTGQKLANFRVVPA